MVNIMMLRTCPEGKEVVQAPWEFVTAMRINGLEESAHDPGVHCQNVEVSSDRTPQDWRTKSTQAQDHDLDW